LLLANYLSSSNHPIRPREHAGGNRQPEGIRRFEIDHQLEARRLLDRQAAGSRTF
jgi:hypothetical protein